MPDTKSRIIIIKRIQGGGLMKSKLYTISPSVAGFLRFFIIRFLSPSFVVRYLHLQFVCLSSFILLLGPWLHPMCLAQNTGLYLCCQFHAQFCILLVRFKFHFFRFVVVHSSQVHLVWLYDHHLRRFLVASYRPPCICAHSLVYLDTSRAASDCSGTSAKSMHRTRIFHKPEPRFFLGPISGRTTGFAYF